MSINFPFTFQGDETTQICGFERIQCLADSVKSILGEKIKNITSGAGDQCNCLPACTQISYSHEISQANFDLPKLMRLTDADSKELNSKYFHFDWYFFFNPFH